MIINDAVFKNLDEKTIINKDVLTEVTLLGDYLIHDNSKNFFLIEGSNDRKFYKKVDSKNEYLAVGNIINDNQDLNNINQNKFQKNKSNQKNEKGPNRKELIISILSNVFQYSFLNERKIYGIVDRDYDEPYPLNEWQSSPNKGLLRIFSDTAHDIEMIMISTDEDLLNTLNYYGFKNDNIYKALYMAYQMATVKEYVVALLHYSIPKEVRFDKFFDGINLNIKEYIEYINKISIAKKKATFEDVIKKMRYNKSVDNKNNFIKDFNSFKKLKIEEFKHLINGHDFLNALAYLQNKTGINNKFNEEILFSMLFKKYNVKCFEKSSLYKQLKTKNLV